MADSKFPTQANCDARDPEEAFLWMLAGSPGMKGAPLPFPISYLRQVSKRLWDCGARPHQRLQTIKYRPPAMSDPHWLTAPGQWVDKHEPDPVDVDVKAIVSSLSQGDKVKLKQALGLAEDGE